MAKRKKVNNLPILIVIFLLGIVLYFFYRNIIASKFSLTGVTSKTPSGYAGTGNQLEGWEVYAGPDKDYSFSHPPNLKSDTNSVSPDSQSVRFIFMGESQIKSGRTQTELADGYYFGVTKIGSVSKFDPKSEVEKQYASIAETCPEVNQQLIRSISINTVPALQYDSSCFGNFTVTYLTNGVDTFQIIEFYSGEKQPEYKSITNQILGTFRFANRK